MHEPRSGDPRERLAHRALHADPVELAHREHASRRARAGGPLSPWSSWRTPTSATRRGSTAGIGQASLSNAVAGEAEHRGEHHPVHVAARRGLRTVEVSVGVDPEHSARAVEAGEPADRAERDRVVAAEHQRAVALLERCDDEPGDVLARLLDLRQEPCLLVAGGDRLGDRSANVAPVHRRTPISLSRASSPAYRIADGPMSTPRRPCPRSSGAPMIATVRLSGCALTAQGYSGLRPPRRRSAGPRRPRARPPWRGRRAHTPLARRARTGRASRAARPGRRGSRPPAARR